MLCVCLSVLNRREKEKKMFWILVVQILMAQIFFLSKTLLKVFPQHSYKPIVSCVRFPFLSGFPAIFQVFFAFLTSFPHLGHFAILLFLDSWYRMNVHKTFSIMISSYYSARVCLSPLTFSNCVRKVNLQGFCSLFLLRSGRFGFLSSHRFLRCKTAIT